MEKLEKIIKYLDGEVIGEEKQLLEKEIATNQELNDTLIQVKELNSIVSDEELVKFVNTLIEIKTSKEEEKVIFLKKSPSEPKNLFLGKKLLVAASITILVVITSILIFTKAPSNENLFNEFYSRYDASSITRGDSEIDDLTIAIQLYDKKQYSEAISRFNEIIKTNKKNTAAYFFIGISYMEINSFDKAIENLNVVISQKDSAFIEHAEWYLALCYLKTNKSNNAKMLLNEIASGNSFYQAKALELQRKYR